METATQQLPPGQLIGPYQIVRRLGAGGMGEVYLARHRHLERDAAIKVLLPEICLNQTVVSRFFIEARATAQLRHANIVEVLDCDVLPDGRAYIVMEYLRGESLRASLDRLGTFRPDFRSIGAIAGLVADALQAAHDSGIIHRDLKPDNVYLSAGASSRDGLTLKVLDFGTAKLLSGGTTTGAGATPTRTGSLIGTPLYMSPEQCRGIATIDHRSDIYSLGCMMFEMVVGQPPFVAEAPGDILMGHILQQPPLPSAIDPSIPRELDALIARMLAKDPAARPQAMTDVMTVVETLFGVPRTELASLLRAPAGFPEAVGQLTTQVLPTAESPSQSAIPVASVTTPVAARFATPARPPIVSATAITPVTSVMPAAPPTRLLAPTPLRTARSPKARDAEAVNETATDASAPGARRPPWLLPVIGIATIVVLGGVTTYLLTRPPSPAPTPTTAAQPTRTATPVSGGMPKPIEVEPHPTFTPPSPTPEPRTLQPSPAEERPAVPPTEKAGPSPREKPALAPKAAAPKKSSNAGRSVFKAVGD